MMARKARIPAVMPMAIGAVLPSAAYGTKVVLVVLDRRVVTVEVDIVMFGNFAVAFDTTPDVDDVVVDSLSVEPENKEHLLEHNL